MKNIIAIIATKNRISLFEKTANSIFRQIKNPTLTIVASDSSDENYEIEKSICAKYGFIIIRDEYEHNYAGNLNSAIDFIIREYVINGLVDPKETFLAFLDDDDVWERDYLQECSERIEPGIDFIVAGLFYKTDEKEFPLSVPHRFDTKSFLISNPHVQGSNTFVRFSSVLEAGCFDENMSSTTDRDIFTRLLMLNPGYSVIEKCLVKVDAGKERPRLTTNRVGKKESLSKFYSKYGGIMTENEKKRFCERANRFCEFDLKSLGSCLGGHMEQSVSMAGETRTNVFRGRIVFSFIAINEELAIRLLKQIAAQSYENKSVVAFLNYSSDNEYEKVEDFLSSIKVKHYIAGLEDAKAVAESGVFPECNMDFGGLCNEIKDIGAARTILNRIVKEHSSDGDAIWILDDDMEFENICFEAPGEFKRGNVSAKKIVERYIGKCDAVVGSYSGDAPLPALSTIRCSLLDYVYAKRLNKNDIYDASIYRLRDYYYSLTDATHRHLETPLKIPSGSSLEDIMSGKAVSRPLYEKSDEEFDPYSRGGNTIVFNRRMLDIPNVSITMGGVMARRGDYFWIQLAKESGFKVIGSSFSIRQNRPITTFDYEKEVEKSIKDLIGSSFTKAYASLQSKTRTAFLSSFTNQYKERLARIIADYRRIIGLLKILEDCEYSKHFNDNGLKDYVRRAKKYLEPSLVESSFDGMLSIRNSYLNFLKAKDAKKELESLKGAKNYRILGIGSEGIVFTDENKVFKALPSSSDVSVYLECGKEMGSCEELYEIEVLEGKNFKFLCHWYDSSCERYIGGHTLELANLLRFLRDHGLVLTNIKKDNFLVVDGHLKYIDYGKSIERFSLTKFQRSVERGYQMLRYTNLSKPEFRQMISMTYLGEDAGLNYGIASFERLIEKRYKEQEHDPIAFRIIKETNPRTFLDYGAGKCKIANNLPDSIERSVYDIDKKTLRERAKAGIRIIENIDSLSEKFDFINCNLVLCCTDRKTNEYILRKIHTLLKDDGTALISICNPFFEDVDKTETRRSGYHGGYSDSLGYRKGDIFASRVEYHRPFAYYERMLGKSGFRIEKVIEDFGVDIDTLDEIGEHIFFVCKKKLVKDMPDCTLLIKANPMEYGSIYRNVSHIVRQLEKNSTFAEVLLSVDPMVGKKPRRYADDDLLSFRSEVKKLQSDGFIDRVVESDESNKKSIFSKYFDAVATESHSLNGQQIFATLSGFEAVKTKYVLQTDSDILYFNEGRGSVFEALEDMKETNALTLSLSICHSEEGPAVFGGRTEVRSCLLDLEKLKEKLPLHNAVVDNRYVLPWHRSLDEKIDESESVRLFSSSLFFVHPENESKKIPNLVSYARESLEDGRVPSEQVDLVNLCENKARWANLCDNGMVLFVRGRNTSPTKLHRLFVSIKAQSFKDFTMVYADDASEPISSEYARFQIKYDMFFKDKTIFVPNDISVGSLANFDYFYRNIAVNPDSIIVNVDNDDCLFDVDALLKIKKEFDCGADVTVGSCLRLDKPLKRYHVESFKECWKRNGDNIWLHPKCFKRYLCNWIQDGLIRDGKFIGVSTDYAIMLPIVEHAENPRQIKNLIYLFDPSKENSTKILKYGEGKPLEMRRFLLERGRKDHEKKVVAVIGDGNILPESEEYKAAKSLGRALVDSGYKVQTGGLGGVMEAALAGAKESERYVHGTTIAVIPSKDANDANEYADVVVPTGLDIMRNSKVVDANAVVVIGGGAGTLSEISIAWQKFKLIIALKGFGGWADKLAGKPLDSRVRYPKVEKDSIYGVMTIEEVLRLLELNIDKYDRKHSAIKWRKNK